MNKIEFYTRYDKLATDYLKFSADRIDMKDKDIRIKELELNQERNQLFADFTATMINIEI